MTKALDVVTIFKCLEQLEQDLLGKNRRWSDRNKEQRRIFKWFNEYRNLLEEVTGLMATGSGDADILNKFLINNKFEPMFRKFGPNEFGVVSILDKMVKWLGGVAKLINIQVVTKAYAGFEIPAEGVNINRVSEGILAKLKTKSDDNLWLLLPDSDRPIASLDMIKLAFETMSEQPGYAGNFEGAQIPKIDFDIKPDIGFLLNAYTYDASGNYWVISQAHQQFKMRMDETGARIKVATGIAIERTMVMKPEKLVFNRPFYGWWTQKGLERLPMAVFYADYDSWKEPAGKLEDL